MKKVLLSITALALVAGSMTFTSCKKGENDPAISFKSRKGRLAGEWTVSSMETSGTDSQTSGSTTTTSTNSMNYDGTTLTMVDASGGNTTTTKNSVSDWSFTFEKDGTWSSNMAWTTTEVTYAGSSGSVTTAITTCNAYTEMSSGNWSFVGKDKAGDYKGKERVVLNTTSSTSTSPAWNCTGSEKDSQTSTYANGENSEIWDIDQLKSKEIIVMMESNMTWSSTPNGGGGSSQSSTSTGSMTLTAK